MIRPEQRGETTAFFMTIQRKSVIRYSSSQISTPRGGGLILLVLEGTLTQVPKVKELRDFFKRTGFIKASKINQAKKHSQQKVKNFDRFVRLDLPKQVARQIPCSGTVYYFVFGFILLIVLLIIIVLSKITIMIRSMK